MPEIPSRGIQESQYLNDIPKDRAEREAAGELGEGLWPVYKDRYANDERVIV